MARKPKIERFNEKILSRFQIYNSLFLTLPFDSIRNTSVLIPLFADHCKNGYDQKLDPREITSSFFNRYLPEYDEKEQIDLLFHFIQYIERQVVLFDAIEDAAFGFVNNMHGRGTIRHIKEDASDNLKVDELKDYLNRFKVRIVLTAHPTQFYPGSVLGIINDLAKAMRASLVPGRAPLLASLTLSLLAARQFGLTLLDGVYNHISDAPGFEAECQQGADMGFDGKTLIHPSQLALCHAAFGPSDEEVEQARKIVAAFADPENAGKGVLKVDGKMTELLHRDIAARTLEIAEAIASRS